MPKRNESLSYLVAVTGLVFVALAVNRNQGFPSRLKGDEAAYLDAASAAGDWGHPDNNCSIQVYLTRCGGRGNSNAQIVFIGDSLAEQWYPRYGAARQDEGFPALFLTKGACLPISGVQSRSPGSNCAQFAASAWSEVFAQPPQKLIIASIWLTYFFTPRGAPRDGVCLERPSGCAAIADQAGLDEVFRRLELDVGRAIAMGAKVYLVGPTPQSGSDYPKAMRAELAAKELLLPVVSSRAHAVATFSNDPRLYSQAKIVALLQRLATHTGATLILPQDYMCPTGVCGNVDAAGKPIYKDRGHLRSSYVRTDAVAWMDRAIGVSR